MIKEAIVKIVNKEDLTYDEAYTVMNEIMSGETTPTQNAAFLAALSTKSARAETTDEIAGCAAAMRAHATKVETGMELLKSSVPAATMRTALISPPPPPCCGGGRYESSKARQPSRILPVWNSRLSGSPRRKHSTESRKMHRTSKRGGYVLLLCTEIPHLYEVCGRYSQGTRFPNCI